MKPFYRLAYVLCQSISRLVFHLSVRGRENIPKTGSFIIASNHVAYFDPVIIGSILKHEIVYLARAELFDQPVIRYLIKKLNAFPVHRGKSDVYSIKTCIDVLQRRKMPLLIFPEGTRIKTGKLETPQRGIAFIATQTKVPILPIYIKNSNCLAQCALFKKRLLIRIGKSINYSNYEYLFTGKKQYSEFAQVVMSRIQRLKDEVENIHNGEDS